MNKLVFNKSVLTLVEVIRLRKVMPELSERHFEECEYGRWRVRVEQMEYISLLKMWVCFELMF